MKKLAWLFTVTAFVLALVFYPISAQTATNLVTITSPAEGTVLTAPASFTIRTSVSGGGNNVAQVQFFEGANLLGADTSNPYRFDVTDLGAGSYTLRAVLTDNDGNQSSNSVGIVVNELPTVTINTPSEGTGLIAPATFSVAATGVDVDGTISTLEFLRNTSVIATTTTNPASVLLKNLSAGEYRFTVVATDNLGGVASRNVDLVVKTRPTVNITSPLANARLTAVTNLLAGTADDARGLSGVEYSVNGGLFQPAAGTADWSGALTLPPGTNVLRVRALDTYGNFSLTNVRSVFQVVTSALTLVISGNGTVSGPADGQVLEVNRGYQLTAVPASGHLFSNWTGSVSGVLPSLGFLMQSNMIIQANFVPNPFAGVAGVYYGLFFETNEVQHGSSGDFRFSLTTSGKYSALLRLAGRRYATKGQLDLEGKATNFVARTGLSPLEIRWAVDLHGADQVTGSVGDGNWVATLSGDRAVYNAVTNPALLAGRYTLIVPGSTNNAPEGSGWGLLKVNPAGITVLSGTLADGTRISGRAPVSRNGDWPLYAPLYRLQGSMLGWIHFDTNAATDDLQGQVAWFKPALSTLVHSAGFTHETFLTGSRFAPPVSSSSRVLAMTNGVLVLSGGELSQNSTNGIALGVDNHVTNLSSNQLALTLNAGTGLFKGAFFDFPANKTVTFSGVVLQKSVTGAGFFLGTNASGKVSINAQP
jgi:hypothetical protein